MKRDAKFAEAVAKLGITTDVLAGTEKRTRKEIIQAAFPPLPTQMSHNPLEEILTKRWETFINHPAFTRPWID